MNRICTQCIMDKSAKEITFDENGICCFCYNAQKMLREIKREKKNLKKVIRQIKYDGRNKTYDCLIGLSGGVDSSLTLHYAVKLGLRPLTFNVDNGWNTPKSDENIMKLVETMKVPFYRFTFNLERFRALQKAFIRSKTLNIEIPTDHVYNAATYQMAIKYGIKWIISGGNVATESIMPSSWGYQARDLKHIKGIYKRFMGEKLKELPTCSLLQYNYYKWIKKIKILYLLDYFDYNKEKAKKLLNKKYGWQDYGQKHCENKFTKWFQEEYLPKFNIDKRRAHYSSLINSKQMTRDQALKLLKKNSITLGNKKSISYKEYPNNEKLYNFISSIIRKLPKSWRY